MCTPARDWGAGCSGTGSARPSRDVGVGEGYREQRRRPIRAGRRNVLTMWAVSDDALLAGLATGDPDAAAAFLQRFQRRVFGLAVTIVGDPRAAEDISQEAFVRAAPPPVPSHSPRRPPPTCPLPR